METMPFRACVCEIRTVYLFMTQMSERDPWHRYNDQWQSTFDTVSKWICECLSTDECVCIGLVCVLLCSQGAGEKGDAGGERNDQDGLFFSQACQTCSSAACQCNTKLRDWNTFHPWPPTGQQWQACSSITKHHCFLSLCHTQIHSPVHMHVSQWCVRMYVV